MKRLIYGILFSTALAGAAYAASAKLSEHGTELRSSAKVLPGYLRNEISMIGYYENTLIKYNPEVFEYHTWYNEDGTASYFNADVLPNGNLSLTASEGKWKFDDGYRPRVVPIDDKGKPGVAMEFNNYFPGQNWRMLLADGPRKGTRELYTLVPGHQ